MPVKFHPFVPAAAIFLALAVLAPVRAGAQVNVPEPIGGMRGTGGGTSPCAQSAVQTSVSPWQSLTRLSRLMPRFAMPVWQPRIDIAGPQSAIVRQSASR